MRSARRGFSLLEILLVATLVAILVSIVAPRIAFTKRTYDLIGAADQVVGDLRRARVEARQRNASVEFLVTNAGRAYQARIFGATTPLWTRSVPNGAVLTWDLTSLRFLSFGPAIFGATATAPSVATFTVTLGTTARRVTLSPLGEVRFVQ